MEQAGGVAQVVKDLFYHRERVAELVALAVVLAGKPEGLNAAAFRDATGLGRKRAIQILEFFDRTGWRVRTGGRGAGGGVSVNRYAFPINTSRSCEMTCSCQAARSATGSTSSASAKAIQVPRAARDEPV